MAAKKYLQNHPTAPGYQEKSATDSSAGAGNAGDIVALDGAGKLNINLFPTGLGTPSQAEVAGEDLSAGNKVYYNTTDGNKMYKADADAVAKKAVGFVLTSALTGAAVTVYFEGINDQLSGLTKGADYYLSTTAGGVTPTKPSTAGQIVQYLGTAISTTALPFNPTSPLEVG
jgi:hypothetical protein